MKHFLFIILLALFTVPASAQAYHVYSVLGKVTTTVGGKTKSVTPKMTLTAATTLTVADASRIVLINEQAKQMCTIKGAAKGNVKQLLSGKSASIKTVSPQYIAILMKRNPNTAGRSTHMQSAATSFRDLDSLGIAEDSVSANKDSIMQKPDSVSQDSIASSLVTMHFGLTKNSTLCYEASCFLNKLTRILGLPYVYRRPSEAEA
jgi:hypothetical protein